MATFVPRKGGILILLLFICFSVFLTEKINFIEFCLQILFNSYQNRIKLRNEYRPSS